jgi:hypothetical protein
MEAHEIGILEAELSVQSRRIEEIFARVDERARLTSPEGTESLSYQLHNLYSAFEELFEIVARAF